MLTQEQTLKARKALARLNNEDEEKKQALEWHKQAKRAFKEYGLPYKVYFNYLKDRANNDTSTIPINPCYPMPGYPVEQVIKVTCEDFDITNEDIEGSRTLEDVYTFDHLCEDKQKAVTILSCKVKPWKTLDENWKRYFSIFLLGYDFYKFTEFDFMGEVGVLGSGELRLMQNYYTHAVVGEYMKHKDTDNYLLEVPKWEPEYNYLYTNSPYELIWDKDTIKERVYLEKLMNIPPNKHLQKVYMDEYGINIYEE
jgi:hypothetical protein